MDLLGSIRDLVLKDFSRFSGNHADRMISKTIVVLHDRANFGFTTQSGAHFNLEIGMFEQLIDRTFKILKNISWKIKILKNKNL
jgi:hypothetical protein